MNVKIDFEDLQEVCKYKYLMTGSSGWYLGCLKRNRCYCCEEECPQITRDVLKGGVYINGKKIFDIGSISLK